MDPIPAQPTEQPQLQPQAQSPFPWLRVLFFVVGCVLILGLIGGAYILGKNNSNNQNTNIYSTKPPVVAIISPTPDPTASWATYTEKAVGLTVKYPKLWGFAEEKQPVSPQFPDGISGVAFSGVGGSVSIQWGGGFGGICPTKDQTINLGGIMYPVCSEITATNGEPTWILYKNTPIASFAIRATASSCPASGCGPISDTVKQQTLTVSKQLILSILSHMQFSTTQDTSSWQTYSGTHFTFQYPGSWITSSNSPNNSQYIWFVDPATGTHTGNGGALLYGDSILATVTESPETTKQYIDAIQAQQIPALASQFQRKTIFLNGKQTEVYHIGGEGSVGWYVPFSNGTEIVDFGALATDPTQDSIELQIIKTFTFTQ